MYVCICNGVNSAQIRDAMDEGARSIDELQVRLGVATCCGSCLEDVVGLLRTHVQGVDRAHIEADRTE